MAGNLGTIEILNRLRQSNIAVRVDGDRLLIDASNGVLTEELRSQLTAHKRELISLLRSSARSPAAISGDVIERADRGCSLPLSEVQKRIWFLDQLMPESTAYLMSVALRVTGDFDVSALRRSVKKIVERHEALRTVFRSTNGEPYVEITPVGDIQIPEVDLSSLPPVERQAEALRLAAMDASERFDLVYGPVWRMKVLRLGEQEHVVLSAVHHMVFDKWSLAVFVRELKEFYAADLEQRKPEILSLPIQFPDFVQWQKRRLEQGVRQANIEYWKTQIADKPPSLELPWERPHTVGQIRVGAFHSVKVPRLLFEKLKAFSRAAGSSMFMTLLAAFDLLLYRLTLQQEILVGAPIAGRDRPETEGLIGFFVNTVALRANFGPSMTFRQFLGQVRETALEAYAHQEMPVDALITTLDPRRDWDRHPLLQVFFNHQNVEIPDIDIHGLKVELFGDGNPEPKFCLTLYAAENSEELNLCMVFDAKMFNLAQRECMQEQFQTLLEQIADNPDRPVEQYSLNPPSLAKLLPDPTAPLETKWEGSVVEHFLDRAATRPKSVAVSGPDGDWTYGELEQLSGGLASSLIRQGIIAGDVVAIYAHRSAQLVLAILAVLRAGAAFSILDPATPEHRLCRTAEAVQPKGWIQIGGAGEPPESLLATVRSTAGKCELKLPSTLDDTSRMEWAKERVAYRAIEPDSLAYVVSTSGTTGEPKCIAGTHRPLSHFVNWHCSTFGFNQGDRFSMLSGLGHDPLLRDIFTPLWLGAALHIPDPDMILTPGYLAEWMKLRQITVIHATPAMATLLMEFPTFQIPTLRNAFIGGDLLTRHQASALKHIAPAARIVNFYGATETPQAMAWHSVDREELNEGDENPALGVKPVPIGRPIADVQILILNQAGAMAGPGEIGEISVRTPYLTLGYENDGDLTRQRFVINPFTRAEKDRCYRTGDLGRYRPDGVVEFMGRADQQVKIRGHRVELAEIETVLTSHQDVRSCAVVAGKSATDGLRLDAYLVPAACASPTTQDLRSYLTATLPDYMIPATFTFLEAIPLTPNGKVDRKALPVAEQRLSSRSGNREVPRNQIERMMCDIWTEVLAIKEVGITDNFFELGGHSITAARLIARLRSAFQVDLPLKSVFLEPTIAELSKRIMYDDLTKTYRYVSQRGTGTRLVPAQPKGSRPPLFLVAGYMNPDDTLLILSRIFPHLGPDQPVYGFQPRWLDGRSKGYSSVNEVVTEFLAELRAFQPEGPYLLGGDCVGGVVALEIARELLRQGQQVNLLVMSDTERPNAIRSVLADARIKWRSAEHIIAVVRRWINGGQFSRMQYIRDLIAHKVATSTARKNGSSPHDLLGHLQIKYRQMIYRHKLQTYPGRITLIVNEEQYKVDKVMGWKGVAAGGLEVISTPGDHESRYTLHGDEFAKRLLGCIERAETQETSQPRPQRSPQQDFWKSEFVK